MTSLSPSSVPLLPHGVRIKFDQVRNVWVLLAPERAFELDGIAVEILGYVDGKHRVCDIVDVLAAKFSDDRSIIEADVIDMLAGLVGRRVLEMVSSSALTSVEKYE